jgi:hypothetical protein
MRLTDDDINGMGNRIKETEMNSISESSEVYNPNWTLRKCCSKLIDKLSFKFPQLVFEIIRPHLENDMQNNNWIIKERSILALGAIAEGSYSYLIHHLHTLSTFLVRELHHPNYLVKGIACWTLSR